MTVVYGQTYSGLVDPAPREGYIFTGWYTAAEGGTQVTSGTVVDNSAENQTLYAHWLANLT